MLFAVLDPPKVSPEIADPRDFGESSEADIPPERDVGLW